MSWSEYLENVKEILNDNGFNFDEYELDHQKSLEKKFKKCFKNGLDEDAAVDEVMGW